MSTTPATRQTFFRYDELRKFLLHLKSVGRVVPLGEWDGSNAIIMRHDVDLDIGLAFSLAQLEKECEINSTYFVRVTCPFYNVLDGSNRKMLQSLAEDGFEIGLHFDPLVYADIDDDEMKFMVDQEAGILADITDHPVISVSIHNPSVHGQYLLFADYRNAYDERIFGDDRYLSDSRLSFRDKDPYQFVIRVVGHPIQILLHPLHYSEDGAIYPEIYRRLLIERIDEMDADFRLNSTYRAQIDGSLIDHLLKNGKAP